MKAIALAVFIGFLSAPQADAQSSLANSRGFVSVNGGYRVTTSPFDQTSSRRENAEDGSVSATYGLGKAATLDVAGGARLWRQFGLGVGITRLSFSSPGSVNASVPHPIFFNRPRSVNGDVAGLERQELAVHVQARGTFPISRRADVSVYGGPSFFQVNQGLITDVSYSETYPYDTAQFAGARTTNANATTIGFNVGSDFAYFFSRNAGIGATIQFSRGTADLQGGLLGAPVRISAGGPDVGAGLRLRF